MRLDVFLKVSRLIKQRSAGREVKVGDRIGVETERRRMDVEVLEIPSGNVPKGRAATLYRVVSSEPLAPEDEWS